MSAKVGFRITGKKGFHVTFANGWTVSVQFGPGNYCANRDMSIRNDDEAAGKKGSPTAEVAAWPPDGELIGFSDGDTVQGYQSPADVLDLLNRIAAMPTPALAENQ